MFPHRLVSHLTLISALGLASFLTPVSAQNPAVVPRINGPVDESALATLRGNVPPQARPELDKGEASPATALASMRLVLSRSPAQQAAMNTLMAQQLDKSSPNYHHWLTPEQFGKLYGPADSDIAAIIAWLESHGLKVVDIPPGRNNIAFSGTVSQVAEAFHTPIHSFDDHGEQFLSNTTDPRIPTALAPVISGVAQLNTIRPRPHSVRGPAGQFDPASHRLVPAGESSATRPDLTTGSTGSFTLFLVPADAATIYDTPNSLNATFASGATSYTGAGVTIGIVGDALIQAATVVDYRTKFLGDTTPPTINNISNSTVPPATPGNDTDEGYLDVEIAGGLAPGASLVFYTSSSLQAAIQQALTDNKVDILSVSFGECEISLGASGNQLLGGPGGLWQQASMAGIAVVVSAGDSGSAGCDINNPTASSSASHGLQVSGFATTPYNIAVGGTDYSSLVGGFTTYANTTNAANFGSAKGYIPESTWNDSTSKDTTVSANIPALSSSNATNIVAGGGGASACATSTGSGCTAGYAKPSWQRGAGVPGDGVRDIPDVSLFAGAGFDAAAWLVCTDDLVSPGSALVQNCTTQSGGTFNFAGFGGTSTAAPAFAGILALVQQKAGGRLGGIAAAQELYNLFNSSKANAVFHDVTVGNNSVVCTSGTPDCQKNTAGNFFLSMYDTTPGFDLATGMGSVDATQLTANWGTVNGSAPATVTLTPSATAITSIQPLTVNVTVTGSGGLPTPMGTVTLSGGNFGPSTTALSAGAASFSITAGTLTPGTDAMTATYNGDSTYAITSNSVDVTVTQVSYSLSATATTPATVTRGNPATATITVSSSSVYSGSVALTCANTTSPANAVDIPACTITGSPITLSASTTSGTAKAAFNTQAPVASLARPRVGGWQTAGGVVLALLVFFGIPSRRRSWRAMVGVLVAVFALLYLSACGSSTTSGGGGGNPGTTNGIYTYTVTGTGTPALDPAPTTTITLTVTN